MAVEVFAGNTGDPKTVANQIQRLRDQFGLKNIVIIGDRGMLTEARLREDVKPVEGYEWITALRAPAIRKLVSEGSLQLSLFDERDLAEITSPAYPDERLVVCRNPLLAEERRRKRNELLDATERELQKVVNATTRKRRPLRGKDEIGIRVGRVLGRFKMAKHFDVTIEEDAFTYSRRVSRIAAEASLDGFYVARTSVPESVMSAGQVVLAYKSLSKVEQAFRSYKTIDLRVRPIFHWLDGRVRAHVFLCMLAYYVEWEMRQRLAPMLFDDDHKDDAERKRKSVVAPAKPSIEAQMKAKSKQTADGQPVHSFRTILNDLGTVTKNTIEPAIGGAAATFDQLAKPTSLQARAFELLGVRCRL